MTAARLLLLSLLISFAIPFPSAAGAATTVEGCGPRMEGASECGGPEFSFNWSAVSVDDREASTNLRATYDLDGESLVVTSDRPLITTTCEAAASKRIECPIPVRLAEFDVSLGPGADRVRVRGTYAAIHPGAGDDVLLGGRGDDVFYGSAGADTARGGRGDDSFFGGPGRDRLYGGAGDEQFHLRVDSNTPDRVVVCGSGSDHVEMDSRWPFSNPQLRRSGCEWIERS